MIHTLGPESTDSYAAAKSLIKSEEDDIVAYPSFDNLIHNIELLKGEYVLFPVAFKSARREYGWKEFNYDYWDKVELVEVFQKKTKPMVLVKNKEHSENTAMIHPATTIFLKKYLESIEDPTLITYTDSKYKAWTAFCKKNLKYTIISEDVFEKERYPEHEVEERYEPVMVWCLYKII
ncbi:hypothetical protein ACFP65_06790 [Marinilactibacillus sp. GCM10026970]|uniref:hypothetical protein n=1 Tax=Marinilactibacillus sp. GCM10026970 TaxID=3252642 RepID=UPI003614FC13